MVSSKLEICPSCGERLATDRESAEATRSAVSRKLPSLLGSIWIAWGLFFGISSLPLVSGELRIGSPKSLLLLTYLVCSLGWFVGGIATLQQRSWGLSLGYLLSCIFLATNLFFMDALHIFIAIGFILLSQPMLNRNKKWKGSAEPLNDE